VRFAGIDVGSEKHAVAIVDETSEVVVTPKEFSEDATGYAALLALLGSPGDLLVVMEATGHYGKNLFTTLVTEGYSVASVRDCGLAKNEDGRARCSRDRPFRSTEAASSDEVAG